MVLKDKLGKELKPLQRIVYPVRRRSEIYLRLATVVSAEEELTCIRDGQARILTLKHPDRCAIVEEADES
jgi:hypothetical protein